MSIMANHLADDLQRDNLASFLPMADGEPTLTLLELQELLLDQQADWNSSTWCPRFAASTHATYRAGLKKSYEFVCNSTWHLPSDPLLLHYLYGQSGALTSDWTVIPVGSVQYAHLSGAAGPQGVVSHPHPCLGTGRDLAYQSSTGLKATGETPHHSGDSATDKEQPQDYGTQT